MTRLTYLVLKPKKANHAHMHSNAPTVVEITWQTPTNIYFGSTGLIMNSTTRKLLRSMKIGPNQFAQL